MDPFDEVRAEIDPLRRAQRAGELITTYQQRSTELARLRRAAIDELARNGAMSTEIARKLNLSKGRITQIRQTAPPAQRAFFGVGPVTVALPLREVPGRLQPMIASEDSRASDMLRGLLERLSFQVETFGIPPDGRWTPRGDTVAICGPKSSRVTAEAIASDPLLTFAPDDAGRWVITDRRTGAVYTSPLDDASSQGWTDIAYVARLPIATGSILVIAGVHALGSVGAVHYLTDHLPDVYGQVGTRNFSMVVRSSHDADEVISSEAVMPACPHE